jgi:hypothetical protein
MQNRHGKTEDGTVLITSGKTREYLENSKLEF